MPKKINALREKLLMCAREILVGRGYSELTIRAIATECGVVPGTIYNYFPSKEKLVESVMLEGAAGNAGCENAGSRERIGGHSCTGRGAGRLRADLS